jgi:hypothetical protein
LSNFDAVKDLEAEVVSSAVSLQTFQNFHFKLFNKNLYNLTHLTCAVKLSMMILSIMTFNRFLTIFDDSKSKFLAFKSYLLIGTSKAF